MSLDNLIIVDDRNDAPEKVEQSLFDRINEWFLDSQKIRLRDKVAFYRLLATMVNSGITVLQALKILHSQQKNKTMKRLQDQMIESVRGGKNLSATLKNHPNNFAESEVAMIESGEKTGKLNVSLGQIAIQIEKISWLTKKLIWALIYPALIIVVMVLVVFIIMWKVVPRLVSIFAEFWDLPKPTLMLISMSNVVQNYWYLFIFLPVIIGFSLRAWRSTPDGRYYSDMFLLRLPALGILIQKVVLSKFSRLLSNLLGNGVSIVEALRIISSAVGNEVYQQRIMLLKEDVSRWVKMAESLEDDPLFPDMLVQMIKVGEETAQLDSIIVKVADFYDEEVDAAVSAINKILEPIIIVTMAVIVGFIAYAVMTPIMQLSDVIGSV